MSLVQMFLTTYQSFTTPETLFSKLMERFNVPDHIAAAEAGIIRMKVGNVLRKRIDSCPGDFSQDLILRRDNFIRALDFNENKTLASLSKTLANAVIRADKRDLESKQKQLQFSKSSPAPKVPSLSLSFPLFPFPSLPLLSLSSPLPLFTSPFPSLYPPFPPYLPICLPSLSLSFPVPSFSFSLFCLFIFLPLFS